MKSKEKKQHLNKKNFETKKVSTFVYFNVYKNKYFNVTMNPIKYFNENYNKINYIKIMTKYKAWFRKLFCCTE